jgi:hypothetical protein
VPAACATEDASWGEKSLSSRKNQAIFTSACTPLGECRIRRFILEYRSDSNRHFAPQARVTIISHVMQNKYADKLAFAINNLNGMLSLCKDAALAGPFQGTIYCYELVLNKSNCRFGSETQTPRAPPL